MLKKHQSPPLLWPSGYIARRATTMPRWTWCLESSQGSCAARLRPAPRDAVRVTRPILQRPCLPVPQWAREARPRPQARTAVRSRAAVSTAGPTGRGGQFPRLPGGTPTAGRQVDSPAHERVTAGLACQRFPEVIRIMLLLLGHTIP